MFRSLMSVFLNTPSVATERAKSLAEKMARLSEGTLLGALELVDHYDEKGCGNNS